VAYAPKPQAWRTLRRRDECDRLLVWGNGRVEDVVAAPKLETRGRLK
jgi:hypothetical protein